MSVFQVINNLFRFNRANWKAVALCFLTAVIFWLFSALNKNHTTNITFPLQFEFDTNRYMPIALPKHASMNVTGNGWDLLRKSLGVRLPTLIIPLDKPVEVKEIPGNTLLSLVAGQLSSLKINYVVGDTLGLDIDLKDTHTFRLVADISNIAYKNGFGRLSPVVILPDSVEIEGPKSILHNFPDSLVLSLSENKLNKDFREEVEVVVPNVELIKRNPPVAEVRFEVGEVEDLEWKLRLEFLNKPTQLAIEGEADSVSCHLLVPKSQGRNILAQSQARATIDLTGWKKGEWVFLPKPLGLSPLVKVLQIDSIRLNLF